MSTTSQIVNRHSVFDIQLIHKWLPTMFFVLSIYTLYSQSTITYTVDPDFNTQETLRSKTSVFDIYPLEDGGFFLGGGFDMFFTNPESPFVKGIAMVTASGDVHPDWGGANCLLP